MSISIRGNAAGPFWRVTRALERQLTRSGGGAAVCIYHRGQKVVDIWGGTRDGTGRPWLEDTMAMSFSTSKGVLSTLIHILADRGQLRYDDPIAEHWPEFGCRGKETITVRHALTHRAGLAPLRPLIDDGKRILDWDYMVRALENAEARPRRYSAYHAITYGWLLGEIVQRVAGASLPEVIDRELVQPLDLDGMYIGAPPIAKRRAAELSNRPGGEDSMMQALVNDRAVSWIAQVGRLWRLPIDIKLLFDALVPPGNSDVFWSPRILDVPVPAANGLFTARSLARMYAAIAGGGHVDGVRLMSPGTTRALSHVRVRGRDRVIPIRMDWRLGYHGAFTTRGRVQSGFGHFGFGGSGAWADPKRDLAVAMVNNSLGGSPFGDGRIASIGDAAMRSVQSLREHERRETGHFLPVPVAQAD